MYKTLLAPILFLLPSLVHAQDKVTLNGYVKDADNGEELLGVTIYIPSLKAGTVSNDYGFYALTVPPGSYEVQFTYIGYKQEVRTLDLTSNTSLNINMQTDAQLMREIVIEERPLDENV